MTKQAFLDHLAGYTSPNIAMTFGSKTNTTTTPTIISAGCHSGVANFRVWQYFGSVIPRNKFNETSKDFINWLFGPTSYYKGILDELKKTEEFEIITLDGGLPKGYVMKDKKFNLKLLINFSKSFRTLTEHEKKLNFWRIYKMEKGYNPGLVYLMMYFYDSDLAKINCSHAPIESLIGNDGVNLKQFSDPDHGYWDNLFYREFPISKGDYSKENSYVHQAGIKNLGHAGFKPHSSIKRVSEELITDNTFFIKRYQLVKKRDQKYNIQDIDNFFQNYRKDYPEFY